MCALRERVARILAGKRLLLPRLFLSVSARVHPTEGVCWKLVLGRARACGTGSEFQLSVGEPTSPTTVGKCCCTRAISGPCTVGTAAHWVAKRAEEQEEHKLDKLVRWAGAELAKVRPRKYESKAVQENGTVPCDGPDSNSGF